MFNRFISGCWALLGMVAILLVAFVLDRLLEMLEQAAALAFDPWIFRWALPMAQLFLAVLAFTLFWYVGYQSQKNLFISIIYAVVGFLLVFFHALLPWMAILSLFSTVEFLSRMAISLTPHSLLSFAGAFVALTGLLGLFFPRRVTFCHTTKIPRN